MRKSKELGHELSALSYKFYTTWEFFIISKQWINVYSLTIHLESSMVAITWYTITMRWLFVTYYILASKIIIVIIILYVNLNLTMNYSSSTKYELIIINYLVFNKWSPSPDYPITVNYQYSTIQICYQLWSRANDRAYDLELMVYDPELI